MRILVVEDDKDLSRQLKQMLKDAGYAVDVANDGEEGHYPVSYTHLTLPTIYSV